MKKTLIALAVAASAVSGMAHAWTNGDFNGSVDIGGSITADDYRQKWSWAVGSDINGFSNALTDLTENGTKLTITVSGNKPILLGKTTEAFAAPVIGGVGAIPVIAFTDFQGNAIQVNGIEQSNAGLGFLPVPMKNAAGSAIGTAKVNITVAGVAGVGGDNPSAPETGLRSLYATPNARYIFTGGMPAVTATKAEIPSGATAANVTALFGSLSAADMLAQIQAVKPTVTDLPSQDQAGKTENMQYTDGNVVSAAYALGIADGQTIEAKFDRSVTASTEWHAPLNVAVTYN
ncbi:fimbrial protein [Escherichia coli]|nr:fimbrial protein [Escherichia coli]EKY6078629.1 fimbrial protein [Escherichia coli]EKY6107690.1 fimbrial protein [Escherichia coli]